MPDHTSDEYSHLKTLRRDRPVADEGHLLSLLVFEDVDRHVREEERERTVEVRLDRRTQPSLPDYLLHALVVVRLDDLLLRSEPRNARTLEPAQGDARDRAQDQGRRAGSGLGSGSTGAIGIGSVAGGRSVGR